MTTPDREQALGGWQTEGGPYTCCRCTASTWNDDDWCDQCVAEAKAESDDEAPHLTPSALMR